MKSATFQVTRKLCLAIVAMSLVSLSAHAKPPKDKGKHSKGNSTTTIEITVDGGAATITSGKEISHVVIWYCDPKEQVKYEEAALLPYLDSTGTQAAFSGPRIWSVAAKAGTTKETYIAGCESEEPDEDPIPM